MARRTLIAVISLSVGFGVLIGVLIGLYINKPPDDRLHEENLKLSTQITDLEADNARLRKQLTQQRRELNAENRQLRTRITDLEKEKAQLQEQLDQLREELDKLQPEPSPEELLERFETSFSYFKWMIGTGGLSHLEEPVTLRHWIAPDLPYRVDRIVDLAGLNEDLKVIKEWVQDHPDKKVNGYSINDAVEAFDELLSTLVAEFWFVARYIDKYEELGAKEVSPSQSDLLSDLELGLLRLGLCNVVNVDCRSEAEVRRAKYLIPIMEAAEKIHMIAEAFRSVYRK